MVRILDLIQNKTKQKFMIKTHVKIVIHQRSQSDVFEDGSGWSTIYDAHEKDEVATTLYSLYDKTVLP